MKVNYNEFQKYMTLHNGLKKYKEIFDPTIDILYDDEVYNAYELANIIVYGPFADHLAQESDFENVVAAAEVSIIGNCDIVALIKYLADHDQKFMVNPSRSNALVDAAMSVREPVVTCLEEIRGREEGDRSPFHEQSDLFEEPAQEIEKILKKIDDYIANADKLFGGTDEKK